MKPNTYLFDFDGTLVDSMPTFVSAMLKVLNDYNVPYGDDIVKIITPLGYKGSAEYFQTLGLKLSTEEIIALVSDFARREYKYNIQLKGGVYETLVALKNQGASLNVLTASPHDMLDPCLKRVGVYELFDNVWSCDDFSTTKADPNIYKLSAEKIGKPVGDIIFLDDNYNACKTAKSSGMKVYGVFDSSSEDYVEEMKNLTDKYVFNFKELI
ncbi:MAG: HAD family hydrolase [Clostridia bacterium]|nr:HAD family hydrolase [Clostridia bacterium]